MILNMINFYKFLFLLIILFLATYSWIDQVYCSNSPCTQLSLSTSFKKKKLVKSDHFTRIERFSWKTHFRQNMTLLIFNQRCRWQLCSCNACVDNPVIGTHLGSYYTDVYGMISDTHWRLATSRYPYITARPHLHELSFTTNAKQLQGGDMVVIPYTTCNDMKIICIHWMSVKKIGYPQPLEKLLDTLITQRPRPTGGGGEVVYCLIIAPY